MSHCLDNASSSVTVVVYGCVGAGCDTKVHIPTKLVLSTVEYVHTAMEPPFMGSVGESRQNDRKDSLLRYIFLLKRRTP